MSHRAKLLLTVDEIIKSYHKRKWAETTTKEAVHKNRSKRSLDTGEIRQVWKETKRPLTTV